MTEISSPKSPRKKPKMGGIVRRERLRSDDLFQISDSIIPPQDNWNLELKEEEISYEGLIEILREMNSERTLRNKKIVSKFIEKTNLYTLIQSFNLDQDVFEDLIITLCSNAKYETFPKDEIIFKIGEQADKFFVILKGEVKIYKPKRKVVNMTKKEYVLYLKKIKDSKDPYLLKKIIMTNKETMDINEYEIPRLIDKINRIHSIRVELEKKKYFMIRLEGKYTKPFENFIEEIDQGIIASNCTVEDIKFRLYDIIGVTESDKEEDALIFDDEKYEVSIFNYEENGILTEGAYFGENGHNSIDRKRTQYIKTNTDAEFMVISNDLYQKNILAEFQKLKNKEISFLNDNCIFKNIQKGTFLNHYFKYFTIEEFWRGENIFVEMQKTEKIYFIKEGRIEVNIYTNIVKMHNYANDLMNIDIDVKNHFKDEEKIPKLNFQPKNYMEYLKKKKFVSLFLFQDNDMLGIEEAFYNFKRLYRATVISDKAHLYSIPMNKFRKMVDFEPKIHEDLKNYSFMKICNLIKRFLNIKNDSMKLIDGNYKEDNNKKAEFIPNTLSDDVVFKENNNFLKKTSNEINIISQVHSNKVSRKDLSNILTARNKLNLAKKSKKNKVYKSVVNHNQIVQEELERYYRDFENWNKQLNKKWELMLNPPSDQFQFYKKLNFEKSAIKELKSDIEKIKINSIENILPSIFASKPQNKFDTPQKIIETNSDNENLKKKNKNKNNNSNIDIKNYNMSPNKIDSIVSSDDSESEDKIESQRNVKNYSINNSYVKTNHNISIDENLSQKNNLSIHINSNAYPTRMSLLNKSKKVSQSNVFLTNIFSKSEASPSSKEKTNKLERNLNNSIESINYNHGNITSRSFKDKEKSSIYSNNKVSKLEKTLNKNSSIERSTIQTKNNNNTKLSSINNSINEENEKYIVNTKTTKKTQEYEFENNTDNTAVETKENKNHENFKSTKLILSQSHNLKTNKLRRIHNEYIPRYYSNKFSKSYIDEINEFNENRETTGENSSRDMKRDFSNDPIKKYLTKKSSNFVPYSVDNSVEAIKKFHKKIHSMAPKNKYNFIIKNY